MNSPLIEVKNIKKYYSMKKGLIKKKVTYIKAVDDVTLAIQKGEVLGLVGESGSGKTTLGRLIMRLIEPTENTVYLDGVDTFKATRTELAKIRKEMGIVFQDPAASLNPRSTIRATLQRPLILNGLKEKEIKQRIQEVIQAVNLREEHLDRYPHMLSGGQQQRVSIARALVLNPNFVVLDEPTSALDVSVHAQILNLLLDVQKQFNLTYLFISHDLNVVRYISDRIGVMYLGKLVEIGPTEEVYAKPQHPYTLGLLSSAPIQSPRDRALKKFKLTGDPASMINPPKGCRLHPRCPYKQDLCENQSPDLIEVGTNHFVACHFAKNLDLKFM